MLMRTVPAQHGSQWLASAWTMFRVRPAIWIALGAIDIAITLLFQTIPFANDLTSVFTVFWAGGMTAAARTCATTGVVRVVDAFDGIRNNLQPLFAASLVALLASLICDFAGARVLAELQMLTNAGAAASSSGTPWLAAMTYAVVALGGAMALWLAPSLIVLYDAPPGAALKASFVAIWRNPWATLVYGAFIAGLLLAAMVTLGIALLAIAPLFYLSTYEASRDLFGEE